MKILKNYSSLQRTLIILTIVLICSCYVFLYHTAGLVCEQSGKLEYTDNLMSSGGEDNLFVIQIALVNVLFLILLLIKKWSPVQLLSFVIGFFILDILSVALIQMGSISQTIACEHNIPLFFIAAIPIVEVGIGIKANFPREGK